MRLTCPNCGAQYEVPDDIIPTAGRDVQCSNCGNTWFQVHPDHEDPAEDIQEDVLPDEEVAASSEDETEQEVFEEIEPPELSISDDTDADDDFEDLDEDTEEMDLGGDDWDLEEEDSWPGSSEDTEDVSQPSEEETSTSSEDAQDAVADAADDTADSAEDMFEDSADDSSEEEAEEAVAAPQRRGLDDSVKDILREEAEFESKARATEEPQSLETQGDLGLDDAVATTAAADAAASRLRRLRNADDERSAVQANPASKETRRDLLPDIEEINSTLRTSGGAQRNPDLGQGTDHRAKRSRGFRLGFAVVLLLAVAAVFVYSSHDMLRQNYPVAAPYIDGFMTTANGARIWLDDQVTQLFIKLNQITG